MSICTGLYVHIPWCIKKCPYCDFNSHKLKQPIDENSYVDMLVSDFAEDCARYPKPHIDTIFIGGGTPSLFSAQAYQKLFENLQKILPWRPNIEITLEANPGAVDAQKFSDYRAIGINRLSIGVQSFQDGFLKKLGRIHDSKQAHLAIDAAHQAGFEHINIDLMYGLPGQNIEEALFDLNTAIKAQPNHISWYELSIEPNTIFYKRPPKQPLEETFIQIEHQGRDLLAQHGFQRYEISAYGTSGARCRHNLNYWLFGDYYGIGAGAHGKLRHSNKTVRTQKVRQPLSYLSKEKNLKEHCIDTQQDLAFEFMLNASRLLEPIPFKLFNETTGLDTSILDMYLKQAADRGFIKLNKTSWQMSPKGLQFNNELIQLFLN